MKRKNVLTIILDQVTLTDIGYAGGKICKTPNIDALAARSVDFQKTYTVTPVCSPARGTFMTGVFPHSHRIFQNPESVLGTDTDMADDHLSIGPVLKDAGYNLGFVGKYHVGEKLPHDYGFEGMNVPGHGSGGYASPDKTWGNCDEYNEYLAKNGYKKGRLRNPAYIPGCVTGGSIEGPEEATVPHFLAETTNELLAKFGTDYHEHDKPFYLTLNFWGPHGPAYSPEPYASMYMDADIQPPTSFDEDTSDKPQIHHTVCEAPNEDWEFFKNPVAYYYGFLTFIDKQIGKVLAKLEGEGLADNTIIIFTADHGGFHGHHGGCLNKGFRMYEEITRVPMLVYDPDSEGGRKLDGFAGISDVYPTILDYANVEIPEGRHGRSLKPIVTDSSATNSGQDIAVTEFHGLAGILCLQRAICFDNYKYVYNPGDIDEFYDLDIDPHEMTNLVNSVDSELLRSAKVKLFEWMQETNDRAIGDFGQINDLYEVPPVKAYGFEVVED
ncbi:sulfatase-like hydrolase/transferase [Candidatus Hydrogenedentota bacterium]